MTCSDPAITQVPGPGGGVAYTGNGTPESVVAADPGALYWDITGQSFWVKNTGVSDTGWVQLIA